MTKLPIEFTDVSDMNSPSPAESRVKHLESERIVLYFTIAVLIICLGWLAKISNG